MTTLTTSATQVPPVPRFAHFVLYTFIVFFTSLRYALATDAAVDTILRDDHNHHRLHAPEIGLADDLTDLPTKGSENEQGFMQYEAIFAGEDRGILGRRDLKADHTDLANNAGTPSNILPGEKQYFQVQNGTIFGPKGVTGTGLPSIPFPRVEISGSDDTSSDSDIDNFFKRQAQADGVMVFITVNTCSQPTPNKPLSSSFPQLTMYVSTNEDNVAPGPNVPDDNQIAVTLEEGFASINLTVKSDIFITILPPNMTDFTGQWNYEIAASIDAPYHNWNNWDPEPDSAEPWNPLLFVDSDTSSALLITQNFTTSTTSPDINEKWLQFKNPFTLFAFTNASVVEGMSHSFCGINKAAQQLGKAPGNTTSSVVTRGTGSLPKGQFYITTLDGGTNYTVMMAMEGNSSMGGSGVVGGGGQVWPEVQFNTKSSECMVPSEASSHEAVANTQHR